MRFRILTGLSFALFMVGACGGTEDLGPADNGDDGGAGIGEGGSVGREPDGSTVFFDSGTVGIDDAGVEGDGGRRHRDGGGGGRDGGFGGDAGFFDGGVFFDGGFGTDTLSGPLLRDANGIVLGELVAIQSQGAVYTIVTSTDYVIDINFDGTFPQQAFLYSAVNCGGTAYLQSGTVTSELLGNTVVYSSSRGSLMIPAGPLTNGAEASVPVNWSSVGDPCQNNASTGFFGWPLVETTAANVGLPATIAAPLSYP